MPPLMRYYERHVAIRYTLIAICIPLCALALVWAAYFAYMFIHPEQQTTAVAAPASTQNPQSAAAAIAALKCPEDYGTEDEVVNAFGVFADNYVIANPAAYGNTKVFITGRVDFLITHHCITTLMNFGYDGKSPITPAIRQKLIDYALNAPQS